MKKVYWLTLGFAFLCLIFTSCNDKGSVAIIGISKTIDSGINLPETTKTVSVDVQNLGGQALILGNFSSTCSCTLPKIAHLVIAPNSKGSFDVTLRFGSIPTGVLQSVAFNTNDPQNPTVKITFIGKVEPVYLVIPSRINLFTFDDNVLPLKNTLVVRFFSNSQAVNNVNVLSGSPFVTVSSIKHESASTDYEFDVVLTKDTPSGEIDTFVKVNATIKNEIISKYVPIAGIVVGGYKASPPVVFVDAHSGAVTEDIKIDGPLDFDNASVDIFARDFPGELVQASLDKKSKSIHMIINAGEIGHNSSGCLYVRSLIDKTLYLSVPFYVSSSKR